jgi:mediator of RNA polymerase II transcription subunit 13
MSSQVATYATPVSTPAPSIQSPENSAALTGGTPTSVETPPELDTDAVLSDVADETWSVILSDRGQDEPTAVSRGLLMKRRGIYDTDDVVAMGVSLMFAPKPNQVSLTDVMALYRDLGTLARLKGIVDSVQSVVPWHVAAAFKAQDALSRTL